MTRRVTIAPPPGYFAAVQIEQEDGTIVGAETCQHPDGSPREIIGAAVKTAHLDGLVLRWVYEDSSQGTIVTSYRAAGRRRLGGS